MRVLAIPLSLAGGAVVLYFWGTTLNTMVLAGWVVALGDVVDDAIIDVENIVRRLRQHRLEGSAKSTARIILDASVEEKVAGINFGYRDVKASLYGNVWHDVDGDASREAGETRLAGFTVTLSGAASATTTTNANGDYAFSGLAAGSYVVTITPLSGVIRPGSRPTRPRAARRAPTTRPR